MSRAESMDKLNETVKKLVKEIRELRLSMVNVRALREPSRVASCAIRTLTS